MFKEIEGEKNSKYWKHIYLVNLMSFIVAVSYFKAYNSQMPNKAVQIRFVLKWTLKDLCFVSHIGKAKLREQN